MKLDDQTAIKALYNAGLGSMQEIREWVNKQQRATIRDQFAMAAMQGMMASPRAPVTDEKYVTDQYIAKASYIIADAAMKERNKND